MEKIKFSATSEFLNIFSHINQYGMRLKFNGCKEALSNLRECINEYQLLSGGNQWTLKMFEKSVQKPVFHHINMN